MTEINTRELDSFGIKNRQKTLKIPIEFHILPDKQCPPKYLVLFPKILN
jgi:hypothetical protein